MCAKPLVLPEMTTSASASHLTLSAPSPWLQRCLPLLRHVPNLPHLPILDLAAGGGRHSRYLREQGFHVLAVDRDPQALAACREIGVECLQLDLEAADFVWPFAANSLAAIVQTNYLHRPLFPLMLNSLAENGLLIVETFAYGNALYGKPSNPDFLLQPGELLQQVQAHPRMRILAYEDGRVEKPAMVQRICALKQVDVDDLSRLGPL